jgi:hypothetical protein
MAARMAEPKHWREAKNAVSGNASKAWHPNAGHGEVTAGLTPAQHAKKPCPDNDLSSNLLINK